MMRAMLVHLTSSLWRRLLLSIRHDLGFGMRSSEHARRLAEIPIFSRCRPRDLMIVARLVDCIEAPTGTVLQHEGRRGRAWYVIGSGTAAAMRNGQPLALLETGDWWGEASLLSGRCPDVSIVALTDMSLVVTDRAHFDMLLHQVPLVSDRLLAGLACRPAPWEGSPGDVLTS
jgi:cAMP-dependent protein kinase regulator